MADFLFAESWQLWAILAIICLIIEMSTGGFFILCFSIGALFAFFASLVMGFYAQLGVFIVFSALSIFFVRPFALKYLHKGDKARRSNADALIGRIGVVSQDIAPGGFGRVAIDGDDWKARSDSKEPLPMGTHVMITGIDSIIIQVTKV